MSTDNKSFNPWPVALVGFLGVFLCLVIAFGIFASRNSLELVKRDYYADEIQYQQQIDRLARARQLGSAVSLTLDGARNRLVLQLPAAHAKAEGNILLYRPSDSKQDQQTAIALNAQGLQELNTQGLATGKWRVKVFWKVDGLEYSLEKVVEKG